MRSAAAAVLALLAPGAAFAQHAGHGQPQAPPRFETPAPPQAGEGPPRAAIAIWGEEAMRASRAELFRHAGGQRYLWLMGDRLEYRVRAGEDGYLWDVQGFYGGDIHKLFFKSEGEGGFGEPIEQAELQVLYSRAITRFFDVQAGLRGDFAEP
ncbi:MAG: copper resistance protein B, partial [Hyphomonadaceae bacterium]|nr:copper resistance protein B [Hyphomonadaceae bacterium]